MEPFDPDPHAIICHRGCYHVIYLLIPDLPLGPEIASTEHMRLLTSSTSSSSHDSLDACQDVGPPSPPPVSRADQRAIYLHKPLTSCRFPARREFSWDSLCLHILLRRSRVDAAASSSAVCCFSPEPLLGVLVFHSSLLNAWVVEPGDAGSSTKGHRSLDLFHQPWAGSDWTTTLTQHISSLTCSAWTGQRHLLLHCTAIPLSFLH